MTQGEVKKLLYVIQTEYPEAFRNFTEQDYEDKISLWLGVLEDYSYAEIGAGLKIYLASDRKGYAPKAGQLIDCITKNMRQPGLEASNTEYVAMIRKALGNSAYHAEEEFAALPEICQRAVGNPHNLYEWCLLDVGDVETVIMSQVIKALDAARIRMREEAKIPTKVRALINRTLEKGIPYKSYAERGYNMEFNPISKPSHYCEGRKYEPKDVIRDWNLNFNLGNAVKYISRAGRKPGSSAEDDLKKAMQYVEFELEHLRGYDGK